MYWQDDEQTIIINIKKKEAKKVHYFFLSDQLVHSYSVIPRGSLYILRIFVDGGRTQAFLFKSSLVLMTFKFQLFTLRNTTAEFLAIVTNTGSNRLRVRSDTTSVRSREKDLFPSLR